MRYKWHLYKADEHLDPSSTSTMATPQRASQGTLVQLKGGKLILKQKHVEWSRSMSALSGKHLESVFEVVLNGSIVFSDHRIQPMVRGT